MSASDLVSWMRLARTKGVGPMTIRRLITRFETPARALEALPSLARRGGRKGPPRIPDAGRIEAEIAEGARLKIRFLALDDPAYPDALRAIEDAPPVLAFRGRIELAGDPGLAIVGARNASLNGRKLAGAWAGLVGEAGHVVTSGLARGIDTAAHEAALGTGTIAVLAGGVDVIYPRENTKLYEAMAETGLILSEHPLGMEPLARHFPQRNRIISGLSRAVLVVEAARRSGSLITARLANEQGREVMAVPGSPLDARAQGCNDLIRAGAQLVQTAEDVIATLIDERDRRILPLAMGEQLDLPAYRQEGDALDIDLDVSASEEEEDGPSDLPDRLIEALDRAPTSVDELLRACQVSAGAGLTALLELELAGRIERHPGNRVSRRE